MYRYHNKLFQARHALTSGDARTSGIRTHTSIWFGAVQTHPSPTSDEHWTHANVGVMLAGGRARPRMTMHVFRG